MDKLYSCEPLEYPDLLSKDTTMEEKKTTTTTKYTSLSSDRKPKLLTTNIAEMMNLAQNYEQSMEELNLKVQHLEDENLRLTREKILLNGEKLHLNGEKLRLNAEIVHLNDELQRASIKADQQASDINAKASENSTLEEKLKKKQQEITELEEIHEQKILDSEISHELEIIKLEEKQEQKLRDCQLEHEQNLQEQLEQSEVRLHQRLREQ